MFPKGKDREQRKRRLQTKSSLPSFAAGRMQRCSEHLQTFKSGRKTALRVGPEPAELGQTQAQCMLLPFKNRLKQVEFQFSSPLLGCGTVSHMNLRILPTEQLAQTPALSKALLLRGFIL